MSEIDEDVMKRAVAVRFELRRSVMNKEHEEKAIYHALMEAKREERERCARIADELQYSADAAFNERVTRSRNGEKNLELAASAAAGMSHQARKAAAAIRKGASHDQA